MFAWFSALGTAAFISILVLTSVAVVAFFLRQGTPDGWWACVVAPVLSVVAFSYVGYLALDNYTLLNGGSSSAATWLLVAVPVSLVAGLVRGATRKSIDYGARIF